MWMDHLGERRQAGQCFFLIPLYTIDNNDGEELSISTFSELVDPAQLRRLLASAQGRASRFEVVYIYTNLEKIQQMSSSWWRRSDREDERKKKERRKRGDGVIVVNLSCLS
ncbi:unnamed protein product [Linum trigynum]|uniref:Uncharacterized protein n=1 Tax=Linum trigynum TaxID=586398 RepID=A0AAV2DTQ8_9ROSI